MHSINCLLSYLIAQAVFLLDCGHRHTIELNRAVISVSVRIHISRTASPISPHFHFLHIAVSHSSLQCYVLPVLWMTTCLHCTQRPAIGDAKRERKQRNSPWDIIKQAARVIPTMALFYLLRFHFYISLFATSAEI